MAERLLGKAKPWQKLLIAGTSTSREASPSLWKILKGNKQDLVKINSLVVNIAHLCTAFQQLNFSHSIIILLAVT